MFRLAADGVAEQDESEQESKNDRTERIAEFSIVGAATHDGRCHDVKLVPLQWRDDPLQRCQRIPQDEEKGVKTYDATDNAEHCASRLILLVCDPFHFRRASKHPPNAKLFCK